MYNAWAANQNPGCKGSTRLHMDMADAVNVMLFAAPCPDGSPGCAVWDIYRAEDSDKIRVYLRRKYNLGPHYDPIHGQQYYLDDSLKEMLYRELGVISYRMYQRPGEAIFVPAGCAHQASSLCVVHIGAFHADLRCRCPTLLTRSRSPPTTLAQRTSTAARSLRKSSGNKIKVRCGRRIFCS